jgi:mannose-6-phosphate isomerase-like protein (cupin superfamily)
LANYTHLNLKDVEDQAPKFEMSPDLEFRTARVPLELENSGVSYLRIAPDFRMPFGHHHNVQEEVYVLVSGSARLKLDDDVIDLKPFDAVRVA